MNFVDVEISFYFNAESKLLRVFIVIFTMVEASDWFACEAPKNSANVVKKGLNQNSGLTSNCKNYQILHSAYGRNTVIHQISK